jgi:N,N'-diacetylchitobiose transport system substrate-binding protein
MSTGGADFSGLDVPGRYQYAALSFIYDAGGTIATRNGETWTAGLASPQSRAGLTNWADFIRAVSKAPADVDETNLQDVLGQEKTAMIIGQAWMVNQIKSKYPSIADQLAAFPMPGTQGTMPVFLGGSNLVSAAGSRHPDLAYEWIKLMAGTKYQTQLGQAGLMPNTTSLESAVTGITLIQLKAASRSWFTPTSTQWSNVDNAKVLMDMLQAIASGDKSVADATTEADTKINDILNAAA